MNLSSRIFTKRDTRVTCLFSVGCAAKHAAGAACIRVVCCSVPSSRHPSLLRRHSLPLGNVESSVFCLLLPLPSSRHPGLLRRRSLPLGNAVSSVSCLLLPLPSSRHPGSSEGALCLLAMRRAVCPAFYSLSPPADTQAPQKALSASWQCGEQCLLPFTPSLLQQTPQAPQKALSTSWQCREQCLLPFTMCIVTVSSTEPNHHLLQEIK